MNLRLLPVTALALLATTAIHATGPSDSGRGASAIVIVPLEPPPLTFAPDIDAGQACAAAGRCALKDNLRSLGLLDR